VRRPHHEGSRVALGGGSRSQKMVGLTVNGSPARRSQVRREQSGAPLDATNGATGGRRLQAA